MKLVPMLWYVARALLNPGIYAGALVVALALVAAYQVRPQYDIRIGSATDGPLLGDFNTPEVIAGDKRITFRWTRDDSFIILQDVGRQDLDITLSMHGSRPPGQPIPYLQVKTNEHVWLDLPRLDPEIKDYSFTVSREAISDGTLYLHLSTNAFSPPGDARTLGVGVTRLKISPSSNADRFIEPPLAPIMAVVLSVVVIGVTLALLGWGAGGVFAGIGIVGGLAAWLVAADRFWLTSQQWYSAWPRVAFLGSVFVLLVWALGGWLLRRGGAGWTPLQRRVLLTFMLAAFVARLAGQMHPQIWMPDVGFHVNRFNVVETGQLLFMTAPAEWAERPTFYLPTPYLFMMPLYWLFQDKYFMVKLFTVGIATLGLLPVFYIVRRITADGRAALVACGLYVTLPIAVLPFSWCITSNLFGEFFAVSALAVLVGMYPHLRPDRRAFYVLLAVLFVAVLTHPGVVQLTVAGFLLTSALWLLWRRRLGHKVANTGWAVGALIAAFALAYVLYYGNFAESMLKTLGELRSERATESAGDLNLQVGGSVEDNSLGLFQKYVETRSEWLTLGLKGFWQEAQAYYRVWPLLGAAVGYVSIWSLGRRRSWVRGSGQSRLALAAAGWAMSATVFALIGWVMNLYVRYMLFLLPIVAIGGGILLSRLWRRGRMGALLALLVVVFFAGEAIALWHYRITFAFK